MAYVMIILPLTFGLIYAAQLLWTWHSVGEWTRDAARYASTHCWQAGGENVLGWMRNNVPAMPDREEFRGGGVELTVNYFAKDPASGTLADFSCDSECSTQCIPDTVTIRVRNFQHRGIMQYLGLAPIQMPEFQAAVPMESAGCDPEQGSCTP